MPIDSRHPLYDANIARWERCRDAYEGEDAVKAKGHLYLPKVDPQQTGPEYAAYLHRALFYEAVGRTVDGFVGAISRKPHTFQLPTAIGAMVDDATGNGTELAEFIKQLCAESLLLGRGAVLVDFDAEAGRPCLSFYRAEQVINWAPGNFILTETIYETDPRDAFKQIAVPQIRQLRMDGSRYVVTLWRETTDVAGGGWAIVDEIVPTMRGRALAGIPFVWLTASGRVGKIEKPPLLGLVNVAMSHYRSSADLEHGRHFTGMPTLWVTGAASDEPIRIGAAAAIILSDPSARVGYAEFSGQGLGSLETALASKEHMMAVLGAAVFNGPRKGVEAAETARIRTAGEDSLLMGIVSAVEQTVNSALWFAAAWMGASDDIVVKLNRDFIDQTLDPQTLTGLVAAYQAGMITLESFLYSLQQAEMLPPETAIEDEAAALREAAAKKQAVQAALAVKVAAAQPEGPPEAD